MKTTSGLILGYTDQPNGKRKYWQYCGHEPGFTVAMPRKGKSTSVIWPNLILHEGSAVLNDCKLEHARDFARYRQEVMGQISLVHEPFGRLDPADLPRVDGKPTRATYNPIDQLRLSPTPVADAKMMAAAMIPAGNEKPFFINGSRNTFAAWLVFIALDPLWIYPRTIGEVWNVLNQLPEDFNTLLGIMATSTICRGFCAREAKRYLAGDKETVQNIISTVHSACGSILDDPEIIDSLSSTSPEYGFGPLLERVQRAEDTARALAENPDDPELQRLVADTAEDANKARQDSSKAGFGLLQSKPMSIFLCLPGEFQESHARYSRLMLSCVLTGIERAGLPPHDSDRPRTVVFFDEAFSLGAMDQLLASLSRMPAYCTLWSFFQDLSQPKSLYRDAWETFISSAGVVQAFGGASGFTAEILSKKTGQTTVQTKGQSENTRADAGIGTNLGSSGRPCLYPDEISRLDPNPIDDPKQILFYAGQPYKVTKRLRHYVDFPDYMRFLACQMAQRTKAAE